MVTVTTYGPGGFQPDQPDGNVVAESAIDPPAEQATPDAAAIVAARMDDLEAEVQGMKDRAAAAAVSGDAAKVRDALTGR